MELHGQHLRVAVDANGGEFSECTEDGSRYRSLNESIKKPECRVSKIRYATLCEYCE